MPTSEPLNLIEITEAMLEEHDYATIDAKAGMEGAFMFLAEHVVMKCDGEMRQDRAREIVEERVKLRKQ